MKCWKYDSYYKVILDVANNLKDLGELKEQKVWIILEDNNPIFMWPFWLSEVEMALIQAWITTLLDVGLV